MSNNDSSKKKISKGRRKFLAGAMGSLAIPVVSGSSLFGTPASVSPTKNASFLDDDNDRLRLYLTRMNVPTALWKKLRSIGGLWQKVLFDPEERAKFQAAPKLYLSEKNIDQAFLTSDDNNVKLLISVLDPDVNRFAMEGDYTSFLAALERQGLFSNACSNNLTVVLNDILDKEDALFSEVLNLSGNDVNKASIDELKNSDSFRMLTEMLLNKDIHALSGDGAVTQAVVVAGVVAVIAVIAAVYVSVGTTLTVGITAGFAISLAVMTAITVNGGPVRPNEMLDSIVVARGKMRDISTFEDLLLFDDNLKNKTEHASRVATILGSKAMYRSNIQHTLALELDAILDASEQAGIVNFGSNKSKVHAALHQLVCEAAIGRYDIEEIM